MKRLSIILSLLLIPQLVFADYILKGPHTTVETDGTQSDGSVNLITKNAGPINFYTNNTLRSSISSSGDYSTNASSFVLYLAGDANRKFSLSSGSDTSMIVNVGDGTTANFVFDMLSNDADGSDDTVIRIGAGGSIDTSRGSYLQLQGNEVSGGADVILASGNATGSGIIFRVGAADATVGVRDTTNQEFLTFDPVAGTTGGITFSPQYGIRMAAYVPTMVTTPVAGTNDYKKGMNAVPTAAAATGALLPASPAQGDIVEIMNTGPNEVQIFPGSGDTINGGSANVVVGLGTLMRATCVANSSSAWICHVPIAGAIATPGA